MCTSGSIYCVLLESIQDKTCPTCTSPSSWSTCANNQQSRTNYKCDSATNYQCQSYTEYQSCTYLINQTCPTCQSPSDWSACANNNQTRTNYKCDSTTSYQCQSYTETQSCSTIKCSLSATGYCFTETDCKNAGGHWCVPTQDIITGSYCLHPLSPCQFSTPPKTLCGNNICESGENATACPSDCASTTPPTATGYCGDKVCSGNETSSTCPNDCVSPVITPTTPQYTPNATTPPQPVIQPNLATPQEKIIPLPVPAPLPIPISEQPPSAIQSIPSAEPTKPLDVVDGLKLAQLILAIEGLKIKFETLKDKSESLLSYYADKNSTADAQKWNSVVELFDQATSKLNEIKSYINKVRNTATEGDLDEIINRIENVLLIIDKVIDVMLSG